MRALNSSKDTKYNVTIKPVRDHFKVLSINAIKSCGRKKPQREVEVTALDGLMDDIKNNTEDCVGLLPYDGEKRKEEEDKTNGEEIRNVAMENLGENKKRQLGDDTLQSPPGKKEGRVGILWPIWRKRTNR